MKDITERDYVQMKAFYDQAKEVYTGIEQDLEMDMLDRMIQELRKGGWI